MALTRALFSGSLKAATITFQGGSRVIAVPGKPDTVRGYSANVLLTEFAFFENPGATWRAILPTITNEIKGVKKIRIITTPNGIGNQAHQIWEDNYGSRDKSHWSCHHVDIYEAAAQGLPVSIDAIRSALNDPKHGRKSLNAASSTSKPLSSRMKSWPLASQTKPTQTRQDTPR